MPFKDTIRVVHSGQRRIKIFVDFWNVVINARAQTTYDVDVKWDELADSIVGQTKQEYHAETIGELAGCYVFGSFSHSNPKQKKEIERVLDEYGSMSGLFFNFSERVSKQTNIKCSECGEPVKTSSESGVDVMLTVEMIKHSVMREHEYLALVSSDRDFTPLLSYLRDQGQRVLHVSASKPDREMRSLTWAQIDLSNSYTSLCSLRHDGYIVLTAPPYEAQVKEIVDAAPVPHDCIKVIDITDNDQIGDKDLRFIMLNQNIFLRNRDEDKNYRFGVAHYPDIRWFRSAIASGLLYGHIPHVIFSSEPFAHFNDESDQFPWIKYMTQTTAPNYRGWEKLFSRRTLADKA